jgi:lysyl-tRNA synthetase class II
MHDYKKRYLELFNEITDVIEQLQRIQAQAEQAIIADEGNEED